MRRLLPLVALAAPFSVQAAPAAAQEPPRQCWLDAMSDSEKRDLVLGFARIQRLEGKARAAAWAQEQKATYTDRAVAAGTCPAATAAASAPAPPADKPPQEATLNREGKPCRRLELENVNVPNIGGSMGWALIHVCKD